MSIRTIIRTALVASLTLLSLPALAFPDRGVKIIVAYAPGGATDIIARLLALELSAKWGQPVVVENRPGAGGTIGATQVVRAPADGYTLLLGYTPEVSFNKFVYKNLPYDPISDLTAIGLVASGALVLFCGPRLHVASMKDLLAMKGQSRELAYGSPGIGGQQHLAGAILGQLTGLPLVHVPYRGTSLAVNDLLGGQIDLFFGTIPTALPHVQAGSLKALTVAGPVREKLLPDVPTTAEVGLGELQVANWFGLFAPKDLSNDVLRKITEDLSDIMRKDAFVKSLDEKGLTATPLFGAELRRFIAAETEKYRTIIEKVGAVIP